MLIAGPNSSAGSAGHVLAIVNPASAEALQAELGRLGFQVHCVENPYAAFGELLDRPLVFRAVVVSLPALYREELALIKAVRHRLPHMDVLLAHTDGRHAALAEAMRLGATGLLSDEAIHRLADIDPSPTDPSQLEPATTESDSSDTTSGDTQLSRPRDEDESNPDIEPLLTAEELRALLTEQPNLPEGR
jgi:DNA-binding NtrC family response regulator